MKNNTAKQLCIDIGNSMTDLGIIDSHDRVCRKSEKIPTAQIDSRIEDALKSLFETERFPLDAVLCTVVPEAGQILIEALQKSSYVAQIRVLTAESNLPFAIQYDNPAVLGTDRIANALYAQTIFAEAPCLIIDAGTTVTLDLLDPQKGFCGGMIMPGVGLQLQSLHAGTAALPHIRDLSFSHYPGTSTAACIRLGALYSVSGGIQKIVDLTRSRYGERLIVATCGGSWPAVEALVTVNAHYNSHLTLLGLAFFGAGA